MIGMIFRFERRKVPDDHADQFLITEACQRDQCILIIIYAIREILILYRTGKNLRDQRESYAARIAGTR